MDCFEPCSLGSSTQRSARKAQFLIASIQTTKQIFPHPQKQYNGWHPADCLSRAALRLAQPGIAAEFLAPRRLRFWKESALRHAHGSFGLRRYMTGCLIRPNDTSTAFRRMRLKVCSEVVLKGVASCAYSREEVTHWPKLQGEANSGNEHLASIRHCDVLQVETQGYTGLLQSSLSYLSADQACLN